MPKSQTLPILLVLISIFLLAFPCVTNAYNLPAMPALPPGNESEPGGIQAPNQPEVEKENVARPKVYQDESTNGVTETKKENKNKINHKPLGTRIGTQIDNKKSSIDSKISSSQTGQIGNKSDKDEELLPEEQPPMIEKKKMPSTTNPFKVLCSPSNVPGSPLNVLCQPLPKKQKQ